MTPHKALYFFKWNLCVVAFSFRDESVSSIEDRNLLYSKENGKFYFGIIDGFASYGISEKNISFINYFADTKVSAVEKIKNADIVYFLGGLPNRTMERIKEFDLYDVLMKYNGIVMGYSAGAIIVDNGSVKLVGNVEICNGYHIVRQHLQAMTKKRHFIRQAS